MLSDIEIIKRSKMVPIKELAHKFDISDDLLYQYGNYMAKVELSYLEQNKNKPNGKLVLVSAITPTPTGEGKSTTTIGLVDALNLLNVKAVGAMREPSLGPVFGVKGGAAGGGYAQLNPMVDLNLHFTGDLHAMTCANNLVSACIDNHLYQGNSLGIDPNRITWKRCMDLNDRALREVSVGESSAREVTRKDYFNITVASEIMAIMCLSTSLKDLRERLDNSQIAYNYQGEKVYIKDLHITGSLMVLLANALKPNIIQTLENNMMFVHGGPFANIAHGCNSILATQMALKCADVAVTEAGFGADLGAEKFLDIKCQVANLKPDLVVLVSTIKALKYHGGVAVKDVKLENVEALKKGLENLDKHLETIKAFGLDVVVAINKFESDTEAEIKVLYDWAKERGVEISLSEVFAKGGQGGLDLARKVMKSLEENNSNYAPLYKQDDSLIHKLEVIAKTCYGAKGINYINGTKEILEEIDKGVERSYFICVAKTPASLSDDAKVIGRPKDFNITLKEVRVSSGSRFVICLTGDVMTMPGLSKEPMATKIDLSDDGEVFGLM